jgi:hypothetical protein
VDGDQLTLEDEMLDEPSDDGSWEAWWASLPEIPTDGDQCEPEAA